MKHKKRVSSTASARTRASASVIDHPTREDAERLLEKARAEVRVRMRRELEAERVSNDLMNFRMKTR